MEFPSPAVLDNKVPDFEGTCFSSNFPPPSGGTSLSRQPLRSKPGRRRAVIWPSLSCLTFSPVTLCSWHSKGWSRGLLTLSPLDLSLGRPGSTPTELALGEPRSTPIISRSSFAPPASDQNPVACTAVGFAQVRMNQGDKVELQEKNAGWQSVSGRPRRANGHSRTHTPMRQQVPGEQAPKVSLQPLVPMQPRSPKDPNRLVTMTPVRGAAHPYRDDGVNTPKSKTR